MVVSNANGNDKLMLDSMLEVILDEEAKRRVSEYAKSSGNDLNVEVRGLDNKKMKKSKH